MLRRSRLAVATIAIALLLAPVALAQTVTEPSLKAAFIYNFMKFTEWPEPLPASDPFVICVLGDSAVGQAQMRLAGDARGLVSYALQNAVDQQTDLGLPNSPRHVAKARLSVPGPTRESFVSVEGQYLSSRATLAGPPVPGAAIVNLHVVQPLGRSWGLFGGVQNVFDAEYSDPVAGTHRQDAIEQNGRTARIGLRWNVWTP